MNDETFRFQGRVLIVFCRFCPVTDLFTCVSFHGDIRIFNTLDCTFFLTDLSADRRSISQSINQQTVDPRKRTTGGT